MARQALFLILMFTLTVEMQAAPLRLMFCFRGRRGRVLQAAYPPP